MIVLALDTCFAACSAAVLVERDGAVRITGRLESRRTGHSEALPGMIDACAREAGVTVSDVTLIAVTRGPGTFTGVRVGISAARALALVTGAPIVTMTSLALIAATALDYVPTLAAHGRGGLLVAAPGPQAYLYVQRFDPAGSATTAAEAVDAREVLDRLSSDTKVIGPAAPRLADLAAANGQQIAVHPGELLADARVLARRAATLVPLDGPLLPLYLRPPDAKPQDGRSLPRAP